MSDQAGSAAQQVDETTSKGKGKAPAPDKMDVSMGEDDSSSEGESETEEPVSRVPHPIADFAPLTCPLSDRRRYDITSSLLKYRVQTNLYSRGG
jgi:hypothetical protein